MVRYLFNSIKISEFIVLVFGAIFCLFFTTGMLPMYIGKILSLFIIVLLALIVNRKILVYKSYIPFLLLCFFIALWSTKLHSIFISFISALVFLFFAPPTIDGSNILSRLISFNAIVNGLAVILELLFPDLFWIYGKLVFSEGVLARYLSGIENGYYFGFNYEIGYTALYIMLGVFVELFDSRGKIKIKLLKLSFYSIVLIILNKRSIVLSIILVALLVFYESATKKNKLTRIIQIIFCSLCIVISLFGISKCLPNISIFNRIGNMFSQETDYADYDSANKISSGRVAIWAHLIKLFMEHKLLGIGWENFSSYTVARSSSGGANQGHNVFLQLLCETGIIGFLLFSSLSFYYLIDVFKTYNILINVYTNKLSTTKYCHLLQIQKLSLSMCSSFFIFWFVSNPMYSSEFIFMWVISIYMNQTVKKELVTCGL